jgi:hypothetical protein
MHPWLSSAIYFAGFCGVIALIFQFKLWHYAFSLLDPTATLGRELKRRCQQNRIIFLASRTIFLSVTVALIITAWLYHQAIMLFIWVMVLVIIIANAAMIGYMMAQKANHRFSTKWRFVKCRIPAPVILKKE